MINISRALPVMAVILYCGIGSASAAALITPPAAVACSGGAFAQLLAATPGGRGALDEIVVYIPAPSLAPRSEAGPDAVTYDTSRADLLIKGMAASARRAGRSEANRLLLRLLKEGAPKEKLDFASGSGKSYAFPARFYSSVVMASGICQAITETFCTISCINTGTANEQCREDCRNIIVRSCD